MRSPVEQIKERLSIVDVVSSYLTLERAGGNMRARCPFHREKTPSFMVSPVRQSYYCFGCGAKGDIFTFVEAFEGTDFLGALKTLAERSGVPLHYERQGDRDKRDRLYECLEAATDFFEKTLTETSAAKAYLVSRGISDATIASFRIGYAPDDWRAASGHLRSLGFTTDELAEAGITKTSADAASREPYDRFRGRIMFPISDSSGRIIGFSGRILVDDGKSAKYINSPDTPLYDKSSVFYGLDKAKLAIRTEGYAILVEGQIDLVLLHQYGYTNAVASSGTAVAEAMSDKTEVSTNFSIIKRLTNDLVLSFDGDKAGIKAASRAAMIALGLGMDVKVVKLPEGMDPADVLRKDKTIWQKALAGREPIVSFLLAILLEKVHDRLKINAVLREKILPFIARMPSAIDQAYFVKLIHDRTGIPESALYDDVGKIVRDVPKEPAALARALAIPAGDLTEEQIFAILLWQERIDSPAVDAKGLRLAVAAVYGDDALFVAKEQEYLPRTDELIFQAEMLFKNDAGLQITANELVGNLEERFVRKRLDELRSMLTLSERNGQEDQTTDIIKDIQLLSKKLEEITKRRFA